MSNGTMDRRKKIRTGMGDGSHKNGVTRSRFASDSTNHLHPNPNINHQPDRYEDIERDFSHPLFAFLENSLPPNLPHGIKSQYMRKIERQYSPVVGSRVKSQHSEYREKIMSNYKPLHRELYTMDPTNFFVPSFLEAINEKTEESFNKIMSKPFPGVLTFEMLQPRFCEMLITEVENFITWARETKLRMLRPNTMHKYGAILDDFGLETMLDKLVEDFILPISEVFFPEVGGTTLDSHHGYVAEYGMGGDVDLGCHVDDSEVTLNVCLGKKFAGGEIKFRGVRCEKHVHTPTIPEESFNYSHVPGQAIVHRGRHRHFVRATTSGHRMNLVLWCRSSGFREMSKSLKEFPDWCTECQNEKQKRQSRFVAARNF